MKTYDAYTDSGGTLLADGSKRRKDDMLIEAIGKLDEVNSFLGIIYSRISFHDLQEIMDHIQTDLCTLNSFLGNAGVVFGHDRVSCLEQMIIQLESDLPPLNNFLLSGSGRISAQFQYVRALTRTAERRVRSLNTQHAELLPYLNRLSDVMFLLARTVDHRTNRKERLWQS